jgi:hypothetical protein
MLSDWVLFLAYPNLFEIKDFIVVVVVAAAVGFMIITRVIKTN